MSKASEKRRRKERQLEEARANAIRRNTGTAAPGHVINTTRRTMWFVWCLVPLPLVSPLVLPFAIVILLAATFITLCGLYLTPQAVFMLTQEQLQTYGAAFYKHMMFQCLLLFVIAAGFWILGLRSFRRALAQHGAAPITPENTRAAFRACRRPVLLSVVSAVALAVGVMRLG